MAPKITSSSTRSKRSSNKPVTQGQNPQRANRQKVASKLITRSGSSAVGSPTGSGRTTYSEDRGQSTNGSAQRQYQQSRNISRPNVTQGRGGTGTTKPERIPSTKALPPGQKGGAVTKPSSNSNAGGTRALPPGRAGGALARRPGTTPTSTSAAPRPTRGGAIEKAGPTIDVKANTAKLSAGSTRPSSNARPALPGGRLGELMKDATTGRRGPIGATSGRGMAAEGAILAAGSNLIDKYGQALGRAIRTERAVRMSADGGRYVPGDQQRPTPAPAPAKPKPKPPTRRPAPTQSGGASTPSRGSSRGSSSGSGGSAPRSMPSTVTRPSGPAPDAGMKNQDKNYRGNLFEKTFGYKPGQAPDQTKGSSTKFDTKSDLYIPSTKVDGSSMSNKNIDMKKVDEYNRRRRRYYD